MLALRDLPTPATGPGEVRMRVEAAGINYRDLMVGAGSYPGVKLHDEQAVGLESVGVIDDVG